MTYTARFDPQGRGATEDEDQWGFQNLTWGKRQAEIDVDIRAKPWVSPMFVEIYNPNLIFIIHLFPASLGQPATFYRLFCPVDQKLNDVLFTELRARLECRS